MSARHVNFAQLNRDEKNLLFIRAGLGENLTAGAGHKALSPELKAIATDGLFKTDAVDRGDEAAVGNGMRTLNGFPRTVLVDAVFRLLGRMPADGRRIKQDLRTLHGGEPGAFGIPLVPADQHANLAELGVPRLEASVARREVELLVEERVVRDVHLPVDTEQFAISVDDNGGVVIEPTGTLFEERGDDHDTVLLGDFLERLRARTGYRFGQFEVFVVLGLAEILRAEEFLRADNLGALLRGFFGEREGLLEVCLRVGRAAVLKKTERDFGGFRHGRTRLLNRRPC